MIPRELDTCTRTVWGEARGAGMVGMRAVAHVIINRAQRPKRFRDTLLGVCAQPLQFSCWNEGDPNLVKMKALDPATEGYKRAYRAVLQAMLDDLNGEDLTSGADHYFADSIDAPSWSVQMTETAWIGGHRFFRE